ncbi:unnamed protein product [marine sediment metagenome]|uniref:Fibronectin type III-like domain-containing protein n=1 Tax=marine sediment metagenome TaxID=412755 RepID=X1VBN2_9ZZZZ
METREVTLNPGASQEVIFTFTPEMAKDYAVSVNGLTGTFRAYCFIEVVASKNS